MPNEAPAAKPPTMTVVADAVAAPPPPKFTDPDRLAADTIARFGDDPDFVTALARGLAVMLALSDRKRRMSIAQVSHRTGIPRAAARRSLHTLSKLGFVAADDARRFYLRPRVLSFSHAYLSASPLAVLAQPILDRLGESLHEACSLAILDGDEIVYLARSASSRIMSPALNVGRRLPAYCTSIGQVMLAHLRAAGTRRLPGAGPAPPVYRAHADLARESPRRRCRPCTRRGTRSPASRWSRGCARLPFRFGTRRSLCRRDQRHPAGTAGSSATWPRSSRGRCRTPRCELGSLLLP